MHAQNAYLPLLALVRSGQLDLSLIKPHVFPLADLELAMEAATTADSLELGVVSSREN
jgi:alcohol dehydrogenase